MDSGLSQRDKTIKINRKALFAVNVQLRRINVDETGYKVYARYTRKKKKQLKSSKYKVFLNVKCIFHAFQYHPTCHRLLIRFIYYSLIGSSISCANYVSGSHVYWQSLTSDDVSLMPNIPSSENWDMYRSVGVLVHFQLNDISVTKWRDYDALR